MSNKTTVSATQRFYQEIFNELPQQDIDESCLPQLAQILDDAFPPNSKKVTILKMFFGIGYDKRYTYQEIANVMDGRLRHKGAVIQSLSYILRKIRLSDTKELIKPLFMLPASE